MVLTQDQVGAVIRWLDERWGRDHPCTMCNHRGWNLSDRIFELREFQRGGLIVGGDSRIYPVVPITCGRCGNTVFLNAITIGVIAATPAPAQGGQR